MVRRGAPFLLPELPTTFLLGLKVALLCLLPPSPKEPEARRTRGSVYRQPHQNPLLRTSKHIHMPSHTCGVKADATEVSENSPEFFMGLETSSCPGSTVYTDIKSSLELLCVEGETKAITGRHCWGLASQTLCCPGLVCL